MASPTKTRITVGLEQHDYDALADVAEKEERSLSWLVAQAVKLYLKDREQSFQFPLRLGTEERR